MRDMLKMQPDGESGEWRASRLEAEKWEVRVGDCGVSEVTT